MSKFLVANYKMNGDKKFFRSINSFNKIKLKDTKLILCPPFVYLNLVKAKHFSLGAQDVSAFCDNKSTGEISAEMLKDYGVKYVIIGHSERRARGETDKLIQSKIKLAFNNGITPIVCVGEKNYNSKIEEILNQVESALVTDSEIIFAYEPVWAIGTGKLPTINKINKAVDLIKTTAKQHNRDCKVLYGGSVNKSNYKQLLTCEIDGFLVGGLSLKLNEFLDVLKGIEE